MARTAVAADRLARHNPPAGALPRQGQIGRVMAARVLRVAALIDLAAAADINLTIATEKSDRLKLSLAVCEALADHAAATAPQWAGFGLAIRRDQTRARCRSRRRRGWAMAMSTATGWARWWVCSSLAARACRAPGPKAGGPHDPMHLCAGQTPTINTAAAGGHAALLTAGAGTD